MIIKQISTAITCGLAINIKVIHEIVVQKYSKYKKQIRKDQQTIKHFDKFCRKCLQDNLIDENEIEYLCEVFIKNLDETKNESLLKI